MNLKNVIPASIFRRVDPREAIPPKDAAVAQRAQNARAATGSTVLTIQMHCRKGTVMTKTALASPKLTPPVGPFSQAIRANGFVFFSGQVGQDPATGKLVEGGVAAETEQIFQNLAALLETAGKSFEDVVRVGVFLTNMGDYAAVNAVYAKHFEKPFPARTAIGAAALPLGAHVEIDLIVAA